MKRLRDEVNETCVTKPRKVSNGSREMELLALGGGEIRGGFGLKKGIERPTEHHMNKKQKVALASLAGMVMGVFYWTGFVHGSSTMSPTEQIISVVLPVIFIWTLAKLVLAIYFQRNGGRPLDGGFSPPTAPGPMVPVTSSPRRPPVIHREQAI